jgi:hypothetical protein
MQLVLRPESRVMVDLRATGVLRALGHNPTLTARPEPITLEVGDAPVEVTVAARFRAEAIEVPEDISPSDRAKMRENMLSPEVLDARRFPFVELRATYVGSLGEGRLSGDLVVRGSPRPFQMPVRIRAGEGEGPWRVTGQWEGSLNALGVKPFKALMGALKLEDWIRLRLDAAFDASKGG